MDFDLTADQVQLCEQATEFARHELDVPPGDGPFDAERLRKTWRRCAEFGVPGLFVPAEHGGQGLDLVTCALVLEALGYGAEDHGLLFALNAHLWSCVLPVHVFGDDEQRRRLLPGLCDGSQVGVQAITETGSGSDALAVSTTAEPDGRYYVLNGSKAFISNAPIADVYIVLARTGSGASFSALTTFVVPRGTEGLDVGPPLGTLGLRSAPLGELTLRDCRVPAENVLGGVGNGATVFSTTIEWERSFIMASALGTMRRQVEDSVRHARTHRRFGSPIGTNQAVSHRIVDMRVRLEAGRQMLYRVAWLKERGKRASLESAMVKLFLGEAFLESSMASFENYGAAAYVSGTAQERQLRDAFAGRIYSGTSDLQREVVARLLGL